MSADAKTVSCGPGSVMSAVKKSGEASTSTSKSARRKQLVDQEFNVVALDLGWVDDEFLWPKNETGLKTTYNCKGEIEPLLELTTGRSVCVQAGGALGLFAKYLALHFESVYTFEPNPVLFTALCANAPERNIYKFPVALTDNAGHVHMATTEQYEKSNMGAWWCEKGGPIPSLRLDSFHFDALDLLILDIEGGEMAALEGAVNALRHFHPVIHLEWKDKIHKRAGVNPDALHQFLTDKGYELVRDKRNERTYV